MTVVPTAGPSILQALTDGTGLLQHAFFGVPNRSAGYTTDDNSRALLAAVQCYEQRGDPEALQLASVYLSFLHHAVTPDNHVHNLMAYDRRWIDARGSDDCLGRTLWAAGHTCTAAVPDSLRMPAREVFDRVVTWAGRLRSPRGMAFSLLGLCAYARDEAQAPAASGLVETLAGRLLALYEAVRAPGWEWFEDSLTYSNAMLPCALLEAYSLAGDARYAEAGRATLDFLIETTVVEGVLQPIGCNGWYRREQARAWFDQQPVDAAGMVLACLAARRILGDERYRQVAELSYEWFHGRNALGRPLIDPETGACYDGLMPDGVNLNQGAESQVSYWLASLAMAGVR